MQKNHNKMGTEAIGKLLLTMSWPAVISMMIHAIYSVVDSIFVAQRGEEGLTAITLIFPIQMLMIAVAVGTGVGINSLISRRLGERKQDEANLAASNGIRLAAINWIFFALFGLFLSGIFMGFFTENSTIFNQGKYYLMIITIGSLFILVQITLEKIIQATGNMIIPMIFTITGGVVNVILDPLFIFGVGPFPEMGVVGAAIATTTGEASGMTLAIVLARKYALAVKIDPQVKFQKKTIKDIYAVGAPAILMQAIFSVMGFFFNSILASFSATAVAVYGVLGRMQSFIFMPVFGINQGAMPIMGFNYGARNKERLMKTFKTTLYLSMIVMGIGMLVFQILPKEILSVFNPSAAMEEMGVTAFRSISLCYLPAAFGITASCLFSATGHGFISLGGAVLRQLVGILPLAYLFGMIGGVNKVWWSYPAAEVLGLLYAALLLIYVYRKEINHLGEPL